MIHDPVALVQNFIRYPSITPNEAGALDWLQRQFKDKNFHCDRLLFSDHNTPDIDNLYATIGVGGKHLLFAGHSDVVPPGDTQYWSQDPFSGTVHDGLLYGRGAVDMKGGIAAFMAASFDFLEARGEGFSGRISFMITGDEEGPAINGTIKMLQWAEKENIRFDGCLVGEPTNPQSLGDMIKIGRRGSVSAKLVLYGTQGHVAYPHLADNPVPRALECLSKLAQLELDQGNAHFQPSNLEITSVDVGNPALNVIPAEVSAQLNIRFNDMWDGESLEAKLREVVAAELGNYDWQLDIVGRISDCFLTQSDELIAPLREAIETVVGRTPELSTTGGTSDARFIKDYCPVMEFGLVGKTMHKIDECVAVEDLTSLKTIYRQFLENYFV